MIANIMPMFTIFQDYYAFGVEVYFTRTGELLGGRLTVMNWLERSIAQLSV